MIQVYDHGTYIEKYFDQFEDLKRYLSEKGLDVAYPDDLISRAKEYFVTETKNGYVLSVQVVTNSEVKRYIEFCSV